MQLAALRASCFCRALSGRGVETGAIDEFQRLHYYPHTTTNNHSDFRSNNKYHNIIIIGLITLLLGLRFFNQWRAANPQRHKGSMNVVQILEEAPTPLHPSPLQGLGFRVLSPRPPAPPPLHRPYTPSNIHYSATHDHHSDMPPSLPMSLLGLILSHKNNGRQYAYP